MQDVVYKQGQAGVRKASVTIVFNNDDKNNSPVGYEAMDKITVTRQVAVGGRNKLLINGATATLKRVSNLFHSVSLNVKNPHFLIMQGMITKVLNMKPPEILGLIKETAGTKMFEEKKEDAHKTIKKKSAKVEEIKSILNDQITPTLESLRKQREQYHKWLENKRDFDRLDRFRIAYNYSKAKTKMEEGESGKNETLLELETRIADSRNLLVEKESEIRRLTSQKEESLDVELKELEKKVDDVNKKLIKQRTTYKLKESTYQKEEKNILELESQKIDLTKQIEILRGELETKNTELEYVKQEKKDGEERVTNLKRQLQSISVGVAAGGINSDKTLADQLLEAKRNKVSAETEARSGKLRRDHAKKELKKNLVHCEVADSEYKRLTEEKERLEKQIEELKEDLDGIMFDPDEQHDLYESRKKLGSLVNDTRHRLNNMRMDLSNLELHYSDPTRDFDRRKVRGLVANHIELKDPKYSTALQVAGKGKLYNIIVDDNETANLLFKKGNLKRRTTFMPLDKMNPHIISQTRLDNAVRLVGEDKVAPALSLVNYDEELLPAIAHVFGNTLVCTDLKSAETVAYDRGVKALSVTLDGNVYDPAGTATGGALPSSSDLLIRLQEMRGKEQALVDYEEQKREVQDKLENMESIGNQYRHIMRKLKLKEHELNLLQDRISQTPYFQLLKNIEELRDLVDQEQEKSKHWEKKALKFDERIEELESQIENFDQDSQLRKTERLIEENVDLLDDINRKFSKTRKQVIRVKSELEQLSDELEGTEEQLQQISSEMESAKTELEKSNSKLNTLEEKYEDVSAVLENKRGIYYATDASINQIVEQRDIISNELEDLKIEFQKLKYKLDKQTRGRKTAIKTVNTMLEKYPWISKEEQFFGQPQSDYDFDALSIGEVADRIRIIEEEQAILDKSINRQVMAMYEKAEQEYIDLVNKKEQIEADKESIETFIKKLDKQKNKAVKRTYKKVSRDFGNIFSTVLPGTEAKLEPPEDQSILDGLVVHVAFGGVWKESLSELSGGQRSLLALSLILSLLLFKPAPMYILDEIDAALDLSHTQNIGEMLKTHFTQSQFIIISLKEGMFNNANVVYKVKNINGSSRVERTRKLRHEGRHEVHRSENRRKRKRR
eukprot:TRINITY_DN7634_c0_g1_i2.p1 TRINITY_DN7634_c0_g1~~TRINITY_DN7634_c0_g1_i2.p1  ORF type:complete len:1204 (-),score=347.18 TRINITY_DN7634_c0_g1_i2:45-3431(-)